TAAFSVQNQETMCLQLSGTYTGLAAVVQGTTSPPSIAASSAVWTSIGVAAYPEDSVKIIGITQNGLYCFNTAGLRQIRLNVTAVTIAGTNSLVINASGTTAHKYVTNSPQRKATYTAAFNIVSPATAAVDWATITGSSLDTGAAAANPAAIPVDSNSVAGTAVVATYTTAPSPKGTAVGTVRL